MLHRLLILALLLAATAAPAEDRDPALQRIIDRVAEGQIDLSETGDPASDIWFGGNTVLFAVRNVTRPRLTPVLPDPEKATGAAVIVVPGGGNVLVAHGNEGVPVAQWLADRGIAAFILTYRTVPMPPGTVGFAANVAVASMEATLKGYDTPIPGEAEAQADLAAAIRLVRARARDWGLNPRRIGALGFSAGAIATLNTVLVNDPRSRPAFAGLIYGRMVAVTPPPDAPPVFVAVAADDLLFGRRGFGLVESWLAAGRSVELHYYARGGHGFGMRQQGKTSDAWIDQFHDWLRAEGFLAR